MVANPAALHELPRSGGSVAEVEGGNPQMAGELRDIAVLAAQICNTPIVALSLINGSLQWYAPELQFRPDESRREFTLCTHAVAEPTRVLVVTDTTRDPRFADHPFVTGEPFAQFYAGAPLITSTGQAIGALVVLDQRPRSLNAGQVQSLQLLGRKAIAHLENLQLLAFKDRALSHERRLALEIRAQLSAIGAASSDMVSFVDRRYVLRYVNETYRAYLEKPLNQIEGHPLAEIIGDDAFRRTSKPLLDEALNGNTVEYAWTLVTPEPAERHLDILYTPARDTQGNVLGVVVRARDVTKFHQLESELRATVSSLERVNALQKEFIYILSHDLREPLNSIINFSDMLSADIAEQLDARGRKYLDFITGAGRRMRRLLDDLLSFVRLEQPEDAFAECDLNVMLGEIQQDMDSTLRTKGARIVHGTLPVIPAHPSMLRLLIQNLVSNGLKFQRPGATPEVRVEAALSEKHCLITVADNGIGIPADKLEAIFQIFHRLNPRKEYDGSGLGLAMCRRVAMYHHGRIWAESTPGAGSRFHVELPLRQATPVSGPRAAEPQVAQGDKR